MKYKDFDLLIQPAGTLNGRYRASVIQSPGGEASHDFQLPFQKMEIENYLLRFNPSRQGVRGTVSSEEAKAVEFGAGLFNAVFRGDVENCLVRSLDAVRANREGLRIRLRLNDAPELASLPWEYLYNKPNFFALSSETPIVRYQHLSESIEPLRITPPVRVLVMISSPSGYPRLKVTREWRQLKRALASLEEAGLVKLERMHAATLSALQEQIRQATRNNEGYHIFHFIGHGGYLNDSQTGILIFENDKKQAHEVSGTVLGTFLREQGSVRLVVLNACEGARASLTDPFAGTAQSLIQKGIPAVIAMQFAITDGAAITFADNFYKAIADGDPVDAALSEARRAMYARALEKEVSVRIEWGTPVLYLRAQEAQIFQIEQLPRSIVQPDSNPAPATVPSHSDQAFHDSPLLLEEPEGVMDADSPFYVARDVDDIAIRLIRTTGGRTFFLKAPGQMGRSTLLSRIIAEGEEQAKTVAHLDFQLFGAEAASIEYDAFFKQFCLLLTETLTIENQVNKHWQESGANSMISCTTYLTRCVLPKLEAPLVLAMDEVDNIYDGGYRSDFFTMLRNWSNARSKPIFKNLDIVFVTSAEREWLITAGSQSYFNVGTQLELNDFSIDQIRKLNAAHREPFKASELERLFALTNGHPNLIRRALFEVAAGRHTVTSLFAHYADDDGPFREHLRLLFHRMYGNAAFIDGLSKIIAGRPFTDRNVIFRLERLGVVCKRGPSVMPRCAVYAEYFRRNFHA